MQNNNRQELQTLRDLIRYAVSRLNAARVALGHGSDNTWDEAVYLVLHGLHLPPDTLDPFLDARVLPSERSRVLDLIDRRVTERLPAAYLTGEAWLRGHRFHVDRRVIVPRSPIAELLDEGWRLGCGIRCRSSAPWTCAPGRAAWPSWPRWLFLLRKSTPSTFRPMRWKSPRATLPSTVCRTA